MKSKTFIVVLFLMLSVVFVTTPFTAFADPPGVAASGDQGIQPANGYNYAPGNAASSAGTGTAAGLGSCGAALFAKALTLLGISTGQAALSISAGTAGTAAGTVPLQVPVTDTGAHIQGNGNIVSSAASTISNNLSAGGVLTQLFNNDLLGCIARAIARALIQQTVNGVVNWVRSGFNGSPAFVTDPTTFFTNVANTAAGNFLNSSGLAFLCSPFALQVKIGISQAYSGSGQTQNSCNLIGNWTGFMNNFQNGGWSSFISMTSNPNNQPFGAYLTGLDKLNAAVAAATGNYKNQLTQSGGFLNFQQSVNCRMTSTAPPDKATQSVTLVPNDPTWASGYQYQVCDIINATPGTVISGELSKSIGMNLDELNLAKSFDEIISALITTLMQKVLNGGLLTLGTGSNTTDYASSFGATIPNDAVTGLISQAMNQIPGYLSSAQSVQSIYNQDISNVQSALTTADNTASCWQSLGQATSTADISTLNQDLANYQGSLQSAGASVTALQNYQSQFQNTTDLDTLNNLVVAFTNAMAAGTFPDQGAISGANEDQLGLTASLATINQNESTSLAACQAAGGRVTAASSTPVTVTVAPTCSLSINPTSINQGESASISWASTDANSGTIVSDAGDSLSAVPASGGSQSITPAQSATYTGTFTGTGGSGTCTAQIVVIPTPTTPSDNGGGGN